MTAVKFTFDTHFETGAARVEAAKRSRRSYSSDELDMIKRSAFNEGQASAVVTAQQDLVALLGQMLRAMKAADVEIEKMREEAVALSLACARRLAGAALDAVPAEEISEVLRLAMHEAIAEPRIVVKTPPALTEEIKTRAAEIAHDEGYDGRIQFAPDPALSGADCRIEWKGGGIERSLAAIDTALSELIRRRFPRIAEHQE